MSEQFGVQFCAVQDMDEHGKVGYVGFVAKLYSDKFVQEATFTSFEDMRNTINPGNLLSFLSDEEQRDQDGLDQEILDRFLAVIKARNGFYYNHTWYALDKAANYVLPPAPEPGEFLPACRDLWLVDDGGLYLVQAATRSKAKAIFESHSDTNYDIRPIIFDLVDERMANVLPWQERDRLTMPAAAARLTEDDLKFLRELGKELRTQDRLATAKPVFWQIQEQERIVGIDPGWSDNKCVIWGDEGEVYDKLDDLKTALIEHLESDDSQAAHIEALASWDEVTDFMEDQRIDFSRSGYTFRATHKNAFLTRSAIDAHIAANDYHYEKPIPYCNHAFRNPQLQRLLEIVEKFAPVDTRKEDSDEDQNRGA